jgi:hypothetical protein
MKFFLVIAVLLLLCGVVSAEIYQWVDEKGKRHFTDRPVDAAAPLTVFDSEYQSVAAPESPPAETRKALRRPERKAISADDYQISVRVAQFNDQVILSGRISDGPPCKRFKLDFTVQDEEGHLLHLITVAEDIGGFLSDLLNVSRKVKYGVTGNTWKVIATNGVCQK